MLYEIKSLWLCHVFNDWKCCSNAGVDPGVLWGGGGGRAQKNNVRARTSRALWGKSLTAMFQVPLEGPGSSLGFFLPFSCHLGLFPFFVYILIQNGKGKKHIRSNLERYEGSPLRPCSRLRALEVLSLFFAFLVPSRPFSFLCLHSDTKWEGKKNIFDQILVEGRLLHPL